MSIERLTRAEQFLREALHEIAAIRAEMEATSDASPVPITPAEPTAPAVVEHDASTAFEDYGRFYDFLRGNKMLGPKITSEEFNGCDAILRACIRVNWPISYTAYALATSYLETAMTMQPIKEKGGQAYFQRMYDISGARPAKARELGNLTPGDGARYPGRGYVQLTGKANYIKATAKLQALGVLTMNESLVDNPELAMRPDVAAAVMTLGMQEGWFTGRKLSDDLPRGPASLSQFVASRDIINGRDKDDEIAAFAIDFQTGLQQGGYKL